MTEVNQRDPIAATSEFFNRIGQQRMSTQELVQEKGGGLHRR